MNQIDDQTTLPRIVGGRRWPILGALILNGLAQAGAAAGTALLVRAAFDRLLAGGPAGEVRALLPYAGGMAAAALLVGWLRARERVDAERLGQSYTHALRMTLFGRLSALAPRALQERSQGGVMLRFVGDLNAVKRWVSLGLARLLVAGLFLAGALVALAFLSLALAAAVGAVLVVSGAAAVLAARQLGDRSRMARRQRSRIAANVNDKVAAIGVVQLFGQTGRETERIRLQSGRLRRAMIAQAHVVGRMRGLAEAAGALITVAVLLTGAGEVSAGRATGGTVVAALALVGLLVAPLRDLGRVQEYWHNSRVSLEQMQSFIATPTRLHEPEHALDLAPGFGHLELRDVTLDGSLHGVSAVAEPGSVVALAGPNGAGKSSLLALVARLVDPDGGSVWLDGQDLGVCGLASVREAISMSGPDLPLLRGTVEDNLRYRWPDAPEDELDRVRGLCGLDAMLDELPDGAQTRVRDGGRNLSSGQRQRLTLARALVGRPRVLLLDEADANLDAAARRVVDGVIQGLRGRCTVIVVSHRPEVVEWADAIWRLEAGRLVEFAPADVV